jgi:hypothetical protein
MTQTLRRCIALIAATLGFALPASATTFSTDYTDLWYNAPAESESGWGVNVIQQNEILFVTLFVYGPDGTARWYVGPAVGPSGTNTFTGPLYSATGSYFGAPFNPITATQVGSITFNFTSTTTGTLAYNVGSVNVTKNIVRQTWRNDNLAGHYIGGTVSFGAGCGGNGGILISGEMTVTHSQPNIGMSVSFVTAGGQQGQCNYGGTYSQTGSVGAITGGTYNCTINNVQNAITGTFTITEIRNTRNGFNGRFNGQDNFCTQSGFFGGVRDVF